MQQFRQEKKNNPHTANWSLTKDPRRTFAGISTATTLGCLMFQHNSKAQKTGALFPSDPTLVSFSRQSAAELRAAVFLLAILACLPVRARSRCIKGRGRNATCRLPIACFRGTRIFGGIFLLFSEAARLQLCEPGKLSVPPAEVELQKKNFLLPFLLLRHHLGDLLALAKAARPLERLA